MENPPKKFYRLSPGREVRLRYAYFITCREIIKNAAGEVSELRCTYDPATKRRQRARRPQGAGDPALGVGGGCVSAEVRLYNQLFTRPDPDAGNFAADLNPQSLEVLADAKLEPALAGPIIRRIRCSSSGRAISIATADSAPGRLVFNRTVGLRDTWAKVAAGAKV